MMPAIKSALTVCVSILMLFTVFNCTLASSGDERHVATSGDERHLASLGDENPVSNAPVPGAQTGTLRLDLDFAYPSPVITPNPYADLVDVRMPGISTIHLTGRPELPREPVSVALEPGMLPTKVEVEAGPCQVIDIEKPVAPRPQPVPVGKYVAPADVEGLFRMGDAYQAPGPFPQDLCKYRLTFGLTQKGGEGRDYVKLSSSIRSQYVDIDLYPVQYDVQRSQLLCYSGLHLSIEYARDPNYRAPMATRAVQYDELMITPTSYVSTMKTLADQRNYTGLQTKLVSLDDVYNGRYFAPSGADNAAKVKNFIKCAIEAWNVSYVLLGGDSGVCPYRTVYIDDIDGSSTPSDLYFSDIYMVAGAYASWNADSDTVWGEVGDDATGIDLRPDVYLGRLPCSSTTQLGNMISKIVSYENNNYGAKFLRNVTLIGLNTFTTLDGDTSGVAEGEYFCLNLNTTCYPNGAGWTQNRLFDSLGTLSSANYALAKNQQVGFMALSDHGTETAWGTFDLSTSDVSGMTNGYNLPIVSVDACLTGAFDYFSDSFSETYLKNPSGGGLCAFAASRIGYGYYGGSHITGFSGLMNTYFHKSYPADEAERVGQMNAGAQIRYCSSEDEMGQTEDYKTICEYVFFGDPGAYIGGFSKTHAKIYCGNTSKTADPGKKATYTVYVENLGSTEAYVKFQLQNPNTDWFVDLNRSSLMLKAFENASVSMDVNVPGGARAGESNSIGFIVRSSNLYESPLSVTTLTIANLVCNFSFRCDDPRHDVALGNQTVYYLMLQNNGNGNFEFNVTVKSQPAGFQVTLSDELFDLDKYDTKTVRMTAQPGPATQNGSYEIVAICVMSVYPDAPKNATTNTTVERAYSIGLVNMSGTHQDVAPGGEAHFQMRVNNLGNHGEKVDMAIKTPLPAGWSVISPSSWSLALQPFGDATFDLGLATPASALAGLVELEFEARLNSTGLSAKKVLGVDVAQVHSFGLGSNGTKATLAQGPLSLYLNISNLGNAPDNYTINLTGLDAAWTLSAPPCLSIGPGAFLLAKMTATPPDGLLAGTYTFTATVRSLATASSKGLTFEMEMPASRGCELVCAVPQMEAAPGASARFALKLRNPGNAQDLFTLSVEGTAWGYSLSAAEVTVPPYGNASLFLDVTVPPNTLAGQYTFKVNASSKSDASAYCAQELTLKVLQVRKVSLEALSAAVQVEAGKAGNFQYRVTNTGNAQDTFRLYFTGKPDRWTITSDKLLTLNASQSFTGNATLLPPDVASAEAAFNIQMFATSEADSNCKANLTILANLKGGGGDDDVADTPANETSAFSWLYVVIPIAIILVIMIAVAVVLLTRSKKASKDAKAAPHAPPTQAQPAPRAPAPAPPGPQDKAEEKPKTSDMLEPELVSLEVRTDEQPEVYAAPEMVETSEQPVYEDAAAKGEAHADAKGPDPAAQTPQEGAGPGPDAGQDPPEDDDLGVLISLEELDEE